MYEIETATSSELINAYSYSSHLYLWLLSVGGHKPIEGVQIANVMNRLFHELTEN